MGFGAVELPLSTKLIGEGDIITVNESRGELYAIGEIPPFMGSMTVMLPLLGDIEKPVLTSPRLGVQHLRELLEKKV